MDWHYENGRIYGTDEKGELMCEATFVRKENGEMNIDHTYVNHDLRGQGAAGKMMEAVAEYFRKEGYRTTASCSYANIWLKRHEKQYAEILSETIGEQAAACKIDGKH
ncbi:putative acetyltransferase [Desulfosporosinus orientis DSM 765]|uniref:Putative acetyltransferase n=1 Tax=Desulfosporosinus orientis (strain ATCC 19365 / DSM 765 / NCIMB 8382 / VKM B-1628 / Singapore I) TaxID=768706 RepID=G7WIS8_DESOD|nr:GNAT family N-acetyltransferase [Desulfosporosinus orientis]AET69152.1 putative acetyltransferase [Desulfosporosinus orientis DSM 765]